MFNIDDLVLNDKVITTRNKNLEFWIYRNLIQNLDMSLFEYEGFNKQQSRFIEQILIENGCVALLKIEGFEEPVISAGFIEKWGRYNQPILFRALPFAPVNDTSFRIENQMNNITTQIEDLVYYKTYSIPEDGIVIFNNASRTSDKQIIYTFADKLADLITSYYVNVQANKTPLIFKGSEESIASFTNIWNKISSNSPFLYFRKRKENNKLKTKSDTILDDIEVLNLTQNFIAPSLRTEFNQELALCLNILGIDSFSSSKKERLITDEIQQNSEFVNFQREIKLQERKTALEEYNELFGTNLSVKLLRESFDVDSLIKKESEGMEEEDNEI